MARLTSLLSVLITIVLQAVFSSAADGQLRLRDLLDHPYTENLCSAPEAHRLAWTFDIRGRRNIYYTEDGGRSYTALTQDSTDGGQQISELSFSGDGQWLVYVRGGAPEGNWSEEEPVNPASYPLIPPVEIHSIRISARKNYVLAKDASSPLIAPDNKTAVFIKNDHEVWSAALDGSSKPVLLFETRGTVGSLQWSPDGSKIAFVAYRQDHSFIGIFRDKSTPIHWIDPTFARDVSPRWSPTGDSIAFVRQEPAGGAPDSVLHQYPRPWQVRIADLSQDASKLLWQSPNTVSGSSPTTNGGYNLFWAAHNRIIFLSTQDNWPHLYSIKVTGGRPLFLTPGRFMVEYITLSPDKEQLLFSANTGPDPGDIDRRHLGVVSVDKPDMHIITPGKGLEAHPVYAGENKIACISSTVFRPAMPAVLTTGEKNPEIIGTALLGDVFAKTKLIQPQQVIFKSADGTPIHGQLFVKPGGAKKKPAILCIHGGPMRQMLLGWNYMGYYAAHYAVNEWLADHGFIVLSVNYRMGIGYGNDFHHPPFAGSRGASEYQDILAAGKWLAARPEVDRHRIGVYGGSYGGYLTAMALGKNSDIFCAGVDISGVHDRVPRTPYTASFEHAPDASAADSAAWRSSPIAFVGQWTSPVLIIHSDDDRNVAFDQSLTLVSRLKKKGVPYEALVIPDDTHDWLIFNHLVKIYEATTDFLQRKVMNKR